jgi:hypothetical protein
MSQWIKDAMADAEVAGHMACAMMRFDAPSIRWDDPRDAAYYAILAARAAFRAVPALRGDSK